MRIVLDTSCLITNRFSGVAEVTRNLLLHLPLVDGDHHFTLFMNYFRAPKSGQDISYPGTVNHFLRFPRSLVDWWWKHNWPPFDCYVTGKDVYHSLHIQVPPTSRMKTVLTVHDCRYLALPTLYADHEVEEYRRWMKISLNRVERVATVSEFTRQELLSHFPISEDRVRVIHNGFSPYVAEPGAWEKKVERFIRENAFPHTYLLYTGILDPRKNLRRLIEALAKCRQQSQDFPDLILVGIPLALWARSDEAGRAQELGILDHIHLAGQVEKDVVFGLIKKAVALCYPSLYEGFGFPPLEAMALGIPVLASNSSSIPEVSGKAACLVDPMHIDEMAQGLSRIVIDSDYRRALVESGYHQIQKFSWRRAAAEYIKLYQEAAGL